MPDWFVKAVEAVMESAGIVVSDGEDAVSAALVWTGPELAPMLEQEDYTGFLNALIAWAVRFAVETQEPRVAPRTAGAGTIGATGAPEASVIVFDHKEGQLVAPDGDTRISVTVRSFEAVSAPAVAALVRLWWNAVETLKLDGFTAYKRPVAPPAETKNKAIPMAPAVPANTRASTTKTVPAAKTAAPPAAPANDAGDPDLDENPFERTYPTSAGPLKMGQRISVTVDAVAMYASQQEGKRGAYTLWRCLCYCSRAGVAETVFVSILGEKAVRKFFAGAGVDADAMFERDSLEQRRALPLPVEIIVTLQESSPDEPNTPKMRDETEAYLKYVGFVNN